jgi:hypothetical protein
MDLMYLDTACYIPFNRFINEALVPGPNTSFAKFPHLPNELQVRIIQLCDARTLFQLIRTTSFTRAEASTVFFSQPDTYYYFPVGKIYPPSDWHSEEELATVLEFDMDFLRRIEHVALVDEFSFAFPPDSSFGELKPDKTAENIMMFWKLFRAALPSVNRLIVMNHGHCQVVTDKLKMRLLNLFRACPSDIACSFRLFESSTNKFQASVYQLKPHMEFEDASPPWESLPPKPFNLVQPPRPVISGVVGQFQALSWAKDDLLQEEAMLSYFERLVIGPPRRPAASKAKFFCQTEGCRFELGFGQPLAHRCSEWTQARRDAEIQRKVNESQKFNEENPPSFLPFKYGSAFIEKRERYSRAFSAYESRMCLWKEAVGKKSSKAREEYRAAFLAQLGSDPLFRGKGSPMASLLFINVREFLSYEADGNGWDWESEGQIDDELTPANSPTPSDS